MNQAAMFKIGYGLYVLSTRIGEKDNGCIINTVTQVTDTPLRATVVVNKQNLTHDMLMHSKTFNVSVLDQTVPFEVFKQFGFQSGRQADKFAGVQTARSQNGLLYLPHNTSAFLSGSVVDTIDLGTHTLFLADITDGQVLSQVPSVTYDYYQAHIKPKPQKTEKKGWRCKICGYIYEGEELPADFICPLCKHGAVDFEKVG